MAASPEDVRLVRQSRLADSRKCKISIKQWKTLHAVIDCGGYAEAAERLHTSQSAVSYTISKLQTQLGIPLLKIEGRKAQLTDAGKDLLQRSRDLIKSAVELEIYAENLKQRWSSNIRLVVTKDFPASVLLTALRNFSQFGASPNVSLCEASVSQSEKALVEHMADLAISSQVPNGFVGTPLLEIKYVGVAHPNSPLFKMNRQLAPSDLTSHTQIVIDTESDNLHKKNERPIGHRLQWNVSDFDTATRAVCAGIGYAWLPWHRVEKWVERGEMAILPMKHNHSFRSCIYLVHAERLPSGSSIAIFAELLRRAAKSMPAKERIFYPAA